MFRESHFVKDMLQHISTPQQQLYPNIMQHIRQMRFKRPYAEIQCRRAFSFLYKFLINTYSVTFLLGEEDYSRTCPSIKPNPNYIISLSKITFTIGSFCSGYETRMGLLDGT